MSSPIKLLRELIALPSVNPAFLPPGDPRAGEGRVADFLAASAARGGMEIEFQPVLPERRNILARLVPERKPRHHVILAPHLDTVGEPALGPELFQPRQRNERLYGRGACDTKGSVAAMFTALLEVARTGPRPKETLVTFVGLVDEEHGQEGSRRLAAEGPKADLAIVGEPTQLRMVTAHKGDIWLKLRTKGKSAHGARPELGRNAVHAMARIVDLLETDYAAELRTRSHPLLGHPTVNVGTISGGSQPNIVPDQCEISIDRRTLPGEAEKGVCKEIIRFLRSKECDGELISMKTAPCLPLETNPALPLVRRFAGILRQPKPFGVHFFCDASVLSAGGTPSIVFGPGNIAQAHTASEWISLESLNRATQILIRFLRSLA